MSLLRNMINDGIVAGSYQVPNSHRPSALNDDDYVRTVDEDRRDDRSRRNKRRAGKARDKAKARFNREW
jgi:hypothetical protein